MAIQTVTDAIRYVGVDDNTLALFENQYPVQPMGVSYNSYVILNEKIAVMDSVDARATEEWLSQNGSPPDPSPLVLVIRVVTSFRMSFSLWT